MKELQVKVAGMVWHEERDFAQIKAVMEDADRLHATHAKWKLAAEQGESSMRRQGVFVVRAIVRPAEFVDWCKARGLKINAQARNQFANEVALQTYRSRD